MKRTLIFSAGALTLGLVLWFVFLSSNQDPNAPLSIFRPKAKDGTSASTTSQQTSQPAGATQKPALADLVKQFQAVRMNDKEFQALPPEMKHHPAGQIKEVITALAEIYGHAAQNPDQRKQTEHFYSECVKDPENSIFIRRMCEAHGASLFDTWQATPLNDLDSK